MKHKIIYEPVYRMHYAYFLNCNDKDNKVIKDKIKKEFPKVYEELKDVNLVKDIGGKCILEPELGFIGIISRKRSSIENDIASLAHECLHATMCSLNQCNVEYFDNMYSHNEAFTYLLEHLVYEGVCLLKLKKK